MSDFGDEIIDRLHENSSLKKPINPMHKIINNGVGEWFDRFNNDMFPDMFFLDTSEKGYLDLWGKDFGVKRKIDESDEDYRQRIVLESLGHLTVPYLQEVYNLVLYCYVENFDPTQNMLTSDNPYACSNHMTIASEDIQAVLNKKFVIGTELTFIGDDND